MNQQKNDNEDYEIIYEPITDKIAPLLLSNMKQIASCRINNYKFYYELEETPEIMEIAKNELRETPDNKREAIEKLRELLKDEKNLSTPLHNDHWLIRFLRPCKFYPESAFTLIKRYYRFKLTYPNLFEGLAPTKEKDVFQQNILVFQQERDQFGRRILMVMLGKRWNPSEVTTDQLLRAAILLVELALLEPKTQICGVVLILDFEGLTISQASRFTPFFLKKFLHWLQDCVPLRIKNIHIVNQNTFFDMVLKLLKPILREKLKKRLVIHGHDYQLLHKYINPDCLSTIYGGNINMPIWIGGQFWVEMLILCNEEFEAISSYGYKIRNKE